jgi:hypothetical protein
VKFVLAKGSKMSDVNLSTAVWITLHSLPGPKQAVKESLEIQQRRGVIRHRWGSWIRSL